MRDRTDSKAYVCGGAKFVRRPYNAVDSVSVGASCGGGGFIHSTCSPMDACRQPRLRGVSFAP